MRAFTTLAAAALVLLGGLAPAAVAKPGHGGGDEAILSLSAPPPDIEAGDTWRGRISAHRGTEPLTNLNIAVTVTNHRTGRAQTYWSDEVAPGRYEARIVFPTAGDWDVVAQGNGLVADHPGATVAPASRPGTWWPWVLGGAVFGAALALVVGLWRRRPRRAPAPAVG
jgi:hypothetical protein